MGLWCASTGAGGWLLAVVLCVAVIAVAVWGIARLFPVQKPTPDAAPRTVPGARQASGLAGAPEHDVSGDELDIRQVKTNGVR